MPSLTGGDALAVAMTDADGRFAYVNPAFERTTGFAADELLGATVRRLRHRGTPRPVLQDLRAALRRGRPWNATLRIRLRDGQARWVHAHVAPLTDADATVGYLAVLVQPSPRAVERARRGEAADRHDGPRGSGLACRVGFAFEDGRWVRTDPLSRVLRRFDGSLVARHLAGIGALTAASVGTLWMLAPSGPWLWLATAVQLALAAGLVLAFARRVLEPLRGLERTAHRVASGRLDDRSGLERRDEIGRAARALDHLALVFAAVVSDLRDLDGSGPDAAGDPPDAGAARVAAAAERAAAAALQTRALALHAAIEAARSGERGRALARLSHDLRRLALDGTDAVRVAARRGARTEPGQVGRDVRALARLGARAGRLARVLEAPPSRDRGGSGA